MVIVRNEEKPLPNLIKSLKGISDICVLDTGSTDKTIEIAKSFGCHVEAVGDKFRYGCNQEQIDRWKETYGFQPTFKLGEKYFHYANARNYAASLAKNDWVFQADADEQISWDLVKVREVIQNEDHLTYRFCYQHNADGSCGLEFEQSKMYRKSKLRWEKWIHEVLQAIPGQKPKPPKYCDFIYHNHWQNKTQPRGHYLPGLELSVLEDPNDDRNLYYLAREYFWAGKFDESISFFERYLQVGKWLPERSQALIFMGDCYKAKKDPNKAIECYHNAMINTDGRREPFWALGQLYEGLKEPQRALVYYHAAMAVPFQPQGYLNSMELYGWRIPDQIAFLSNILERKDEIKKWWLEALKYNPEPRILENAKWFYDLPLISIVVPTVRPEGYERLIRSIVANTVYQHYEIIKLKGEEKSAIEKFNQGVEEAKGELIVYLADDCEVEFGWLTQAFVCFKENFRDRGLVIFNDNYWQDRIAHHFLCSKNLKEELGGEIWHSGYRHLGADNELFGRLHNKKLIEYCEFARIKHHHYSTPSRGLSKVAMDKYYDKIEKHRVEDEKLLAERSKKFNFKTVILHEGEVALK